MQGRCYNSILLEEMITRATIDKIFTTARVEEVIGEFVSLKKSGSNYKGLSPFTNEKTPSFFVSPSKQIFKCFSSGKGGNVVTFLMEHEQMSYPEALRFLAEKYNIEIEEEGISEEDKAEQDERESLYVVTKFAETFFQEALNSEEGKSVALSYFKERGISKISVETFKLGYNPDAWDALLKKAKEEGYKEDYLLQTGLLKKSQNDTLYDGYKGRVIFPIHNLSGRPIGFGGRTLKSDKKVPKYINSPESPIYDKSNVLYGLYQAKGEIVKEDNCYLVEGYTDVISLHQNGIKNVVASSGTSLTSGQIRLIRRYTQNITILYDGDEAGIKASFRGIDLVLEEGLNVQVVLFPEGEDPDSYAQKLSNTALKSFVTEQARDFMVFKSDILMNSVHNDPIKKSNAIREIVKSIALIPDHITRSLYLKECSSIVDLPERALINELNKIRRNRIREQQRQKLREQGEQEVPETEVIEAESERDRLQKALNSFNFEPQERDVIRILLNYGQEYIQLDIENDETQETETVEVPLAEFILIELDADNIQMTTEKYQTILNEYILLLNEERPIQHQHFTGHEDSTIRDTAIELLSEPYELHHWEARNVFVKTEKDRLYAAAKGALFALKTKHLNKMIAAIQEEIKVRYNEGEPVQELLEKQSKLMEVKKSLSTEQGITILK